MVRRLFVRFGRYERCPLGNRGKSPLKPRKIPQNPPESPLKTPRFVGYPLTKPSSIWYNRSGYWGNPITSARAEADAPAAGSLARRRWSRLRRRPAEDADQARSNARSLCPSRRRVRAADRDRCRADRSLAEWRRLRIGSNVGRGSVSFGQRFAKAEPKRADRSAWALFISACRNPAFHSE